MEVPHDQPVYWTLRKTFSDGTEETGVEPKVSTGDGKTRKTHWFGPTTFAQADVFYTNVRERGRPTSQIAKYVSVFLKNWTRFPNEREDAEAYFATWREKHQDTGSDGYIVETFLCGACAGKGKTQTEPEKVVCRTCGGKGLVGSRGYRCRDCEGKGFVGMRPGQWVECRECLGEGKVTRKRRIDYAIDVLGKWSGVLTDEKVPIEVVFSANETGKVLGGRFSTASSPDGKSQGQAFDVGKIELTGSKLDFVVSFSNDGNGDVRLTLKIEKGRLVGTAENVRGGRQSLPVLLLR